jgi:hypothetical protein
MFRKVEPWPRISSPFSRTTTTSSSFHLGLPGSSLFTLLMWAKLSNALKARPTVEETESPPQAIVSPAQEKHPNLSALRSNDDGENNVAEVPFPFPAPAPPGSPSRHRNGVFRRMSRSAKHDTGEPSKSSSALKLPLRLPKKAKSQVSLHMSGRVFLHGPVLLFTKHPLSIPSFRQYGSRFLNIISDGIHKSID